MFRSYRISDSEFYREIHPANRKKNITLSITIFDSRDTKFRSPFGAVAEGTQVHFRICLPRYLSCSAARLIVHNELTGEDETDNMFWCGMEGWDAEWWEVDYTPQTASLYYYWFELESPSSARAVGKTWAGKGELTANPSAWQLTVYEKDFETPDWLAGGIMYQIFPDSFCRSGEAHEKVPSDRVVHEWGSEVHWQNDWDGTYRTNHYFAGDLAGIESKLDYISSLGVTCIYMNPIFESQENHRYSTADYTKIDPMLGDVEDFRRLCKAAEKRGIRIILDGVFSHTGCDSVYFNKFGRYDPVGAYNSEQSPYRSWYNFRRWPDDYDSWWGFITLPELHEVDPGVMEFLNGKGGVVQRWLGEGSSGWRLDVADELPDEFLDALRSAAKDKKKDAVIIGEVWEDASNKTSYSVRRRYLLGKQLDSVMNYCFKDAIIGFLTGVEAAASMEIIMNVLENYPPQVVRLLMNLIGTHDTERAMTVLAGEPSHGCGRDWQSCHFLSPEQRQWGTQRYKLAAVMQYTLPGVPSVYYGDELGMEGYKDPFNRASFPWGREREYTELIEWHRMLADIRKGCDCFSGADFTTLEAQGRYMAYVRSGEHDKVLVAVNAGEFDHVMLLPEEFIGAQCPLGGYTDGKYLCVSGNSAAVLILKK